MATRGEEIVFMSGSGEVFDGAWMVGCLGVVRFE